MKSNKVCAILGNIQEYKEMGDLVAKRPLATLPFGGKYRLVDFQLSAVANAGIRNVYTLFRHNQLGSVFDHIGSGKEWGLDTLLNRYFLSFYEDKDESYYARIIDFLEKSKSNQTVFITAGVLANIDLTHALQVHKNQGRKMTVMYKKVLPETLSTNNYILKTNENEVVEGTHIFDEAVDTGEKVNMHLGVYIIETDWLIAMLREELQTNTPTSLVQWLNDKIKEEETTTFEFIGYASNIYNVQSYFDTNMDMLDPATFNSLFFSSNKVYTKVKNEAPTYFSADSKVERSQFASGSIIEGEVFGSILSRRVHVKKNATIKSSIIFPSCTIEENAVVEYAILDKLVEVKPGVIIRGTKERPLVIKKGTIVSESVVPG